MGRAVIARALGAILLAAAVGYATPWAASPSAAGTDAPTSAAMESATRRHVAGSAAPAPQGGWNLQEAVVQAFAAVLPDEPMAFALQSSQSSRVEGGGRRFEGSGIGTWGEGDARFVVFTLTLSSRGELVEFDYGIPSSDGEDSELVAGN